MEGSVFKCGLCYELYDGGSHKPLSLGCGHVFCQDCVFQISLSENYVCPIDKSKIENSVYSLPCCYAILANLPKQKPKGICCARHPTKQVKFLCRTHETYLCSECIINHTGKGHNVVGYSASLQGIKQEIAEAEETCESWVEDAEHKTKELEKQEKNISSFYEQQIHKLTAAYDNAIANLQQKKKEQTSLLHKYLNDQNKLIDKYKHKLVKALETTQQTRKKVSNLRTHLETQPFEHLNQEIKRVKQDMKCFESSETPSLLFWSFKDTLQVKSGSLQQVPFEDVQKENKPEYCKSHHCKKLVLQIPNKQTSPPEGSVTSREASNPKQTESKNTEKEDRGRSLAPKHHVNRVKNIPRRTQPKKRNSSF